MPIDRDTQIELARLEEMIKGLSKETIPFQTTQPQPVDQVINNVASGGTSGTIATYTDLSTYANDAAAIRNNLHQLARSMKQVSDALRKFGVGR